MSDMEVTSNPFVSDIIVVSRARNSTAIVFITASLAQKPPALR